VIPPAGGDRHEERFPDDATPEQILEGLTQPRLAPDGAGVLPPRQEGYGRLEGNTLYLDHPETRVVIGRAEKKKFVEVKVIHGPGAA
jgi:hypothetical protein